MTGYENHTDSRLANKLTYFKDAASKSQKISVGCQFFALIGGVAVFLAILPQGMNIIYGSLGVLCIISFIIHKQEKNKLDSFNEEIKLIEQEQGDRKMAELLGDAPKMKFTVSHTHRSRYYPSEKSWTKSPAWAFEIPESELDGPKESIIELICEAKSSDEDSFKLHIPANYLAYHKTSFHYRKEKGKYSLFLSAREKDLFYELRKGDGVDFSQFLENA